MMRIQEIMLGSENHNDQALKLLMFKSINSLSSKQQVIIKLFYNQNYKLKEISEILEISIGTAKSRLFHAREKLKTILKHRDYEE